MENMFRVNKVSWKTIAWKTRRTPLLSYDWFCYVHEFFSELLILSLRECPLLGNIFWFQSMLGWVGVSIKMLALFRFRMQYGKMDVPFCGAFPSWIKIIELTRIFPAHNKAAQDSPQCHGRLYPSSIIQVFGNYFNLRKIMFTSLSINRALIHDKTINHLIK